MMEAEAQSLLGWGCWRTNVPFFEAPLPPKSSNFYPRNLHGSPPAGLVTGHCLLQEGPGFSRRTWPFLHSRPAVLGRAFRSMQASEQLWGGGGHPLPGLQEGWTISPGGDTMVKVMPVLCPG